MFDVNWETRSHADIHAQLQGRGGGFTDAGGAWNSLATRLRDVAGSVERATSGIAATRTGPAAQAAGAAVGPMGPWASEARSFSDAVGSTSYEQNRALAATRGAVDPPVPRPPVTLQTWEGVGALAALDIDSAENASLDAERRARAAMGRYQEFSSLRASGLPQFSSPGQGTPQVQLVAGGSVPTTGGAGPLRASPGVGAPAGSGSTPGSAVGSAPPGAGPAAGGATASPRPGSAGAVPTVGGATASPRPGSPVVAAPGAGPVVGGGGTTASPRPGSPVAVPTSGGGSTATPRPGVPTAAAMVPGFGPSGSTVSNGPAGTGSGLSGSSAGTIPGGGTVAAGSGLGGSTVGTTGATPTRAALEPTRLGGASVLEPALAPRTTPGASGVPVAPVGGVGAAGQPEQRLPRASYLVEDDPDALAGELPRVAPPVIGA